MSAPPMTVVRHSLLLIEVIDKDLTSQGSLSLAFHWYYLPWNLLMPKVKYHWQSYPKVD